MVLCADGVASLWFSHGPNFGKLYIGKLYIRVSSDVGNPKMKQHRGPPGGKQLADFSQDSQLQL
jgi:hypothetical protein